MLEPIAPEIRPLRSAPATHGLAPSGPPATTRPLIRTGPRLASARAVIRCVYGSFGCTPSGKPLNIHSSTATCAGLSLIVLRAGRSELRLTSASPLRQYRVLSMSRRQSDALLLREVPVALREQYRRLRLVDQQQVPAIFVALERGKQRP